MIFYVGEQTSGEPSVRFCPVLSMPLSIIYYIARNKRRYNFGALGPLLSFILSGNKEGYVLCTDGSSLSFWRWQ